MPKPDWLKEHEFYLRRMEAIASMCRNCVYFGKWHHETMHKGKELVAVHECDIHPGCMNTIYSYACEDFLSKKLI